MRSKSPELMLCIRECIEQYFDRYSSTPTVCLSIKNVSKRSPKRLAPFST